MSDTPETESETAAPEAETPAAAAAPAAATAVDDDARPERKVREGRVVSNAMDKTAVVEVITQVRHRRYNKTVRRSKKLHVHDEANDLRLGDVVRVMETRPLSKLKRWRVVEVVERAR